MAPLPAIIEFLNCNAMPFRAERKCKAAFCHRSQGQRLREIGRSRDGLAVLRAGLPRADIQVIAADIVNESIRCRAQQQRQAAVLDGRDQHVADSRGRFTLGFLLLSSGISRSSHQVDPASRY